MPIGTIANGETGSSVRTKLNSVIGAVNNLGTAANSATGDFATAAQGALADTAVQPADIGTAAAEDVGYFATAAQGTKADTALQPAEVKSSNFTAANDGLYVVVASATVTDPSPSEGKGFTVVVRNGTATIGGTGYSTAGSQIRRLFHSGAWATYVDSLTTHTHADATTGDAGFMSASDKTKLDGIETAADVTDAGNVGSSISGATTETTLADTDEVAFVTSGGTLKNIAYSSIKTLLNALYALKGAVTGSGLTMATARILGRSTASTGAVEEISIGSGLSLSGGTLSATGTGGKILQVVQATKTDTASVTGTSFSSVFTASITPSSSSSRVLVMAFLSVGGATSNYPNIRLVKASTVLLQGDTAGSRTRVTAMGNPGVAGAMNAITINYVDSPASTSALTYEIELASHSTGAVYLNRSGTDTDGATISRASSTIILMEVAA
jgi:hypothetical protein